MPFTRQLWFQRNYIAALTDDLVEVLMQIHNRLIDFNRAYSNNTYLLMIHYRGYRKFALNQIHKVRERALPVTQTVE